MPESADHRQFASDQDALRMWDIEGGSQLLGQLLFAAPEEWRKVGHAISDVVFERLTGQPGHQD